MEAFAIKQGISYITNISDLLLGQYLFDEEYLFAIEDIYYDLVRSKPAGLIKEWYKYNSNHEYISYVDYCNVAIKI